MMVIIRAQDFASRTLRRVGNEFAHMSREQMIAARQAQLSAEKLRAATELRAAEKNLGRLRAIKQEQIAADHSARAFQRLEQVAAQAGRARQKLAKDVTAHRMNAATDAADAHSKALKNLSDISRRMDVVHGKGAAAKAIEDMNNGIRRQGPLMKQLRSAVQGVDRAYEHMMKTRAKAVRAMRRAPLTEAQIQRAPPIEQAVRAARARPDVSVARGVLDKANAQWAKLGDMIQKMPSRYIRLSQAINGTSNAQAVMNEHMSSAHQRLARAHAALDENTRQQLAFNEALRRMPLNRMQDLGHAFGGVGRTMQLFGAVSTVALGAAANSAANFNTQVSLAATQARDLKAPISQVGTRIDQLTHGFTQASHPVEGILDLMEKFPAAQGEMADSAYDIFSSMDLMTNGVTDMRKGLELLATANKIAVAGGEDLDIATNAMITTFNNFGDSAEEQAENLDTMFDIIRFGRMRLGDFNTMMNKVAPAAAGANLSLRDVGGAMAFLTEVMPSQRMVATGISRLIEALNHPDIVKGLKMLGVETRKAEGGLRPLDEIMKDLAETFPQLASGQLSAAEFFKVVSSLARGGGQGVMFTAEGRKALTQMITHMDQYLARQKQIDDNKGEFGKAYQAQLKALGIQWDIFMNRIRAIVVAIGTDAIPVFQELGQALKKMLDWWQALDPSTRKSIVRFAVYASVATLLAGALLAVIGAGLGLAAMIGRWGVALKGIEGVGGKALKILSKLRIAAAFLGTIGTISLIVDVTRSGDASAWNLLMGMASGAMMGSAFGPWGALAGAITVPIVLQLIDDFTKPKRPPSAMRRAWQDYLKEGLEPGGAVEMTFEEFRDQWNKKFNKRNFKIPKGITAVEDHRSETSGLQAQRGHQAKLTAMQKEYNEALMKWIKDMGVYNKKKKEYDEELKHHAQAMKEYQEQLAKTIVQANEDITNSMLDMYMGLKEINQQLMGEVFEGPLYSGESGDLMREWGIYGNIQTMIDDARAANALFKQVQSGLNKLRKMGVPQTAIEKIQSMAPKDALGFMKGILKGTPAQKAALIKALKQNNKDVQSQTKMDFVSEIQRFKDAGLAMGDAIKDGFEKAAVGKWFDTWIKAKFPAVINQAVNAAIAQWKLENPPPTAPVAPVRPVRPIKPGVLFPKSVAGDIKQENSNNVTTTYINVSMSGKGVNTAEQERTFGFIIRQAVNGKMRVNPVPNRGNEGRPGRGD
jgi:TP901 family phage tail tape measure protein